MNYIYSKSDIKENNILKFNSEILSILLLDRTTKKNIIWATDNYKDRGFGFGVEDNIRIESITGYNGNVIKPRVMKSKKEQERRIKDKAEVFTPSWICNMQNNLIDNAWAKQDNFFNIEQEKGWITNKEKIVFPTNSKKDWKDYVQDTRLEISCGEAPYLVSRYDNVSGDLIEVNNRIGLLDRKLRVINENVEDKEEWFLWIEKAYKSTYGFEFQGDNLLIARENLLYTFIDNFLYKFNQEPTDDMIIKIASIISWNLWQMDGIKFVIPYSCKNHNIVNISLFEDVIDEVKCIGCEKNNCKKHNGIYCKIMNWDTNRAIKYITLLDRSKKNGSK